MGSRNGSRTWPMHQQLLTAQQRQLAFILISPCASAGCFSSKYFKCQTFDTVKYQKVRLDKGKQQVCAESWWKLPEWSLCLGTAVGAGSVWEQGVLFHAPVPMVHLARFRPEASAGSWKQSIRGWSWEKALCWQCYHCKIEEGIIGLFCKASWSLGMNENGSGSEQGLTTLCKTLGF